MSSYQYRKSHCGDKTILRPSYLHNGISYTGKMTSLYWIRVLGVPAVGLSVAVAGSSWQSAGRSLRQHWLTGWQRGPARHCHTAAAWTPGHYRHLWNPLTLLDARDHPSGWGQECAGWLVIWPPWSAGTELCVVYLWTRGCVVLMNTWRDTE